MSDAEELAHRLASAAVAMANANVPPYEKEAVQLSLGDLNLLVKSLKLADAVRRVAQ